MQTGSGPMTGAETVSGAPHELLTVGGMGTACASLTQGTVDPPSAGNEKVGADTVYVNTHVSVLPVQSVYVKVYVLSPEQIGSALTTGALTDNGSPQELFATGGVGTTCASLIHATVAEPSGGNVNVVGEMV